MVVFRFLDPSLECAGLRWGFMVYHGMLLFIYFNLFYVHKYVHFMFYFMFMYFSNIFKYCLGSTAMALNTSEIVRMVQNMLACPCPYLPISFLLQIVFIRIMFEAYGSVFIVVEQPSGSWGYKQPEFIHLSGMLKLTLGS